MLSVRTLRASRMPVNQIEQRKQINPDYVYEVPVQASHLDGSVVVGGEASFPGGGQKPEEDSHTDDHVQRMQAGHHEIEREENLRVLRIGVLIGMSRNMLVKLKRSAGHVMFFELLPVFDSLDAKEGQTQDQ